MNQYHPGPAEPVAAPGLPGSEGEHEMQRELGTSERAARFYDDQMRDRLNETMREFVARQEMFFMATAGRDGECDNTFRAGPPGFVHVLDERTITYPEYRGNGVMASLGNIRENPHVGILMLDFNRDRIGLHVNGRARLVPDESMRARRPDLPQDPVPGRRPQVWVEVAIDEAYIHCSKHIPHLVKASARGPEGERAWGTDDVKRKGGDFFGVAAEARAARSAADVRPRIPAQPAASQNPPQEAARPGTAFRPPAAPDSAAPDSAAPTGQPAHGTVRQPLPVRPLRDLRSQRPLAPGTVEPSVGIAWAARRLVPEQSGTLNLFGVARAEPSAPATPPDPDLWRREADRALRLAHRRAGDSVLPDADGGFRGWFV